MGDKWKAAIVAAVLIALLGGALTVWSMVGTEERSVRYSVMDTLRVNHEADFDGTANFDGAVTLNSTVTGDVTGDVTGNVTADDNLILSAQTAISVTAAAAIAPTGTYQPLESAGNVTFTLATSGVSTGQVVVLINTANTLITATESTTGQFSGDTPLGQYDSLTVVFDGTYWVEIAQANN